MDRKAAKQLLHIKAWLERVGGIVERGRDAHLADVLLRLAQRRVRRCRRLRFGPLPLGAPQLSGSTAVLRWGRE
jgi:hypothetical protein